MIRFTPEEEGDFCFYRKNVALDILQKCNAYAIKVSSYLTKNKKIKGIKTMTTKTTQEGFMSSAGRALHALFGRQHILAELSSVAAHYDGLIDCIERAGWDVADLHKVRHALDETSQALIGDLLDSHPDMSEAEQRSFLAPFYVALNRFGAMGVREREAFRVEYQRFVELRQKSIAHFVSEAA